MPQKRYLFTPGPTPVPPEVLAALAEPVVHHRGPDYRALFGELLERPRAPPPPPRPRGRPLRRRLRGALAEACCRVRRRRPGRRLRVGRDPARRGPDRA